MSKILSGKENTQPKASKKSPKKQTSDATVQESIQTQGIFSGASIGVINIQILSFLELLVPNKSVKQTASADPVAKFSDIFQSILQGNYPVS